jgi:5,5'-dehydrodivanillate O-demethylase
MCSAVAENNVMNLRTERYRKRISEKDIGPTGPGTLAGRYLRSFWQPVFHAAELPAGRARPIRIMGEDFNLYRGEDGVARLTQPRCPHRAMLLSAGKVQGDGIRCFYHGWKFDGAGACVEQPPEPEPFCQKVSLRTYPVREYLGLVFAYLGEGAAPEFPRYPDFEAEGVFTHNDSYVRPCNFFNNLENVPDISHLAYAHDHVTETWDNYADGPQISIDKTSWGIAIAGVRPQTNKRLVIQFGMPNQVHAKGPANDKAVSAREFLAWWVPTDDNLHTQFTVVAVRGLSKARFNAYLTRQKKLWAQRDLDRIQLTSDILTGKTAWADVDTGRVHLLFLQDDVAQAGCGLIHERPPEQLGRADIGVIAVRKMWLKELRAFAAGEKPTRWRYDAKLEPMGEF